MNYLKEYRDPELAKKLVERIRAKCSDYGKPLRFMEVCGTHTMSIARSGIRYMLRRATRLLSGPGCPVCVTPNEYLDRAIALSRREDVIIATFGDMMKVPGSRSSLYDERGRGARIKVLYSPLDALKIAEAQPRKKVVFLAVGFETTSPTIAATLQAARLRELGNFYVLCGHKIVPPALKALVDDPDLKLDGFICPGHVSAIIGSAPYRFIAEDHGVPCVIAGFEPVDVLESILTLVEQATGDGEARVENQYSRTVPEEGNPKALALLDEVFEVRDSRWRGLGVIPDSGLFLTEAYAAFDAEKRIPVEAEPSFENPECQCGAVLRGVMIPPQCALFGNACVPTHPIGPCMVSGEGTCAAYYKYDIKEEL